MKPGYEVGFHEDGGVYRCTLLEYSRDTHRERAKLRVLEVVKLPASGRSPNLGEEFSVWSEIRLWWPGKWRIFPAQSDPALRR